MRLSEEVRNGLSDPDAIAKLDALDIKPVSSAPREFAKAIAAQLALLKELTTEAGIKPQ